MALENAHTPPNNSAYAFEHAAAALEKAASDADAIRVIEQAIVHATDFRASDIYLEPWTDGLAVRFRIDGVLHDVVVLPKTAQARIVARVKVLARMPVYEKLAPQDGRIDAADSPARSPLRVSTFPTVHGESVVLRLLGTSDELRPLDALGFSPAVTRGLRELVQRPQGVILLTGPTSSGKTTTIYALLREILNDPDRARHVVTIEDPVEYRLGRVAQTQIGPHGALTFVTALRALLRHDPDVLMIGEIRDADTARAAIQAGLTGHLVISTIHSGSAAGVFGRLLDMGAEPSAIASSVTGVLAQRLVRLNCAECKQTYTPSEELLTAYHVAPGPSFRKGTGCAACHGIGYRGRAAIGELLTLNRAFAGAIRAGLTTSEFHDRAIGCGMTTILDDALARVTQGETTLEELRHVLPPEESAEQSETSR